MSREINCIHVWTVRSRAPSRPDGWGGTKAVWIRFFPCSTHRYNVKNVEYWRDTPPPSAPPRWRSPCRRQVTPSDRHMNHCLHTRHLPQIYIRHVASTTTYRTAGRLPARWLYELHSLEFLLWIRCTLEQEKLSRQLLVTCSLRSRSSLTLYIYLFRWGENSPINSPVYPRVPTPS